MKRTPPFPPWINAPVNPCTGIQLRMTDDGVGVLYVHASADADKRSYAWRVAKRQEFTTEADFLQEIDIEFSAKSGSLVFPDFDESIHVVKPEEVPKRLCCYCSLDPHPRTPTAVLWLGVDQWEDIWVYRELWPSKVYGVKFTINDQEEENRYSFWQYADAIAWLEGNELEWRNRGTALEYAIYRQKPGGERIVGRYMDQAAKGFAAEHTEDSKISIAESFQTYGIVCEDPYKDHAAGHDVIHRLLEPRHHSQYGLWPRLHISSDCPELILELKHYRYKQRTSMLEEEELWQRGVKARRHMIDNARYLLCAEPSWIPRLASLRHEIEPYQPPAFKEKAA